MPLPLKQGAASMAESRLYSNSSSFASFQDTDDDDIQIVEPVEKDNVSRSRKEDRHTRLGSPSAAVRASPRRKAASTAGTETSSYPPNSRTSTSRNKSGFDLSSLVPTANRVEIPSKLRKQSCSSESISTVESSISKSVVTETSHISIQSSTDDARLPILEQEAASILDAPNHSNAQNKENQAQTANSSPNKTHSESAPKPVEQGSKPSVKENTTNPFAKSKLMESIYAVFRSSPHRSSTEEHMETVITPESRKQGLLSNTDSAQRSFSLLPRPSPRPQSSSQLNDQLFNAGSNLVQAMEAFVVQNNIEMNDERVKTIVAFDTMRSDFQTRLHGVYQEANQMIEEKYESVVVKMKERYQTLHQELESVKEMMDQVGQQTVHQVETKSKLLLESLSDNEKLVGHSVDWVDSKLNQVEKKLTEEMMSRELKEECLSSSTHAMMERMMAVEKFIHHQSTDLSRIQKELKKMELVSKEVAFQDVLKARRKRALEDEDEEETTKRPRTRLESILKTTGQTLVNATALGFTLYGLSQL